jgi:hypothetical protein
MKYILLHRFTVVSDIEYVIYDVAGETKPLIFLHNPGTVAASRSRPPWWLSFEYWKTGYSLTSRENV